VAKAWPHHLKDDQLSVAARAFKAQALAAAIPADLAQGTEEFRSTVRRPSLVLTR
jgi:hypothetical protein